MDASTVTIQSSAFTTAGPTTSTSTTTTTTLPPEEALAGEIDGTRVTILLSGVGSREDAARVARKVIESAREPMVAGGELLSVTVSVGIATPRPGDDADALLSRADHAMYAVKRRGGGSFEFAGEPEPEAPPVRDPSPTA